jgi:hypothetical protein
MDIDYISLQEYTLLLLNKYNKICLSYPYEFSELLYEYINKLSFQKILIIGPPEKLLYIKLKNIKSKNIDYYLFDDLTSININNYDKIILIELSLYITRNNDKYLLSLLKQKNVLLFINIYMIDKLLKNSFSYKWKSNVINYSYQSYNYIINNFKIDKLDINDLKNRIRNIKIKKLKKIITDNLTVI